jgi:hypothetical protein
LAPTGRQDRNRVALAEEFVCVGQSHANDDVGWSRKEASQHRFHVVSDAGADFVDPERKMRSCARRRDR